MKQSVLVLILILSSFIAGAAPQPSAPSNFAIVRFVSPTGSTANNGLTPSSPLSLSAALAQASPSMIITLLPGTYPSIEITRSGTRLVSQTKWAAQVVGSAGAHGICADDNVANVIIDGIQVSQSSLDGIKVQGPNCTVRNCWVHDSSANGISARMESGTLIDRNLIEHNGTGSSGGNGLNLSGTNCVVRGNVLRNNQGLGIQVYEAAPYSSAGCSFYNNLVYGNNGGITVFSPTGAPNYIFNNTVCASAAPCLNADSGILCVTNNILSAGTAGAVITTADGAQVWSDYNLVSAAFPVAGPHDNVNTSPGFVNAGSGLYWLTAVSPARGAANSSVIPPLDFFGKTEPSVADVGAAQFSSSLAGDTRVLDPSPATGADYWASPSSIPSGGLAPLVVTQPQSQTILAGQNASFTVSATGDAPMTYQWTFNGAPVGSSTSSYLRTNCQLADDGGQVRVTVSNGSGSVQSSVATLNVNPNLTTIYAGPTGLLGNTGLSISSPLSLISALSMAGPSNVIVLLPGTYPSISISHSGTTLKSQVKWGAKIVGSPGMHGIWTTGNGGVSNVVVDGFEVAYAWLDGVKFNGPNSTVRNCWIHNSGQGNPIWAINSDASFNGQGVHSEYNNGTVVEYNLIEYNGACIDHDHGMYLSGTNLTVRGNVVRYNLSAGIQFYSTSPGATANAFCYNNLVYGNGTQAPFSDAIVVYGYNPSYTNFFYGNTILSTNRYAFRVEYGNACLSNNILSSLMPDGPIETPSNPSSLYADYNLMNSKSKWNGSHDVIASSLGFVNPSTGLYWLRSDSPAVGKAAPGICGSVDFFGNPQSAVKDMGAVQYSSILSSDLRVLDPSAANPDYWSLH